MTAAITILAVLAGLVLVVAFWVIGIYNGLVKLRNLYRNAFAPNRCAVKAALRLNS